MCGQYSITLDPPDEAAPPILAQPQNKVVLYNNNPSLSVLGINITVLLTADDTQRRYALARIEASHEVRPAIHTHEDEDEMLIVNRAASSSPLGKKLSLPK